MRKTPDPKIEELLKRGRFPEKLLASLVADLDGRLREGRAACALVVADMKRLRGEIASHENAGVEARGAAERALEGDREDLARAALARKVDHQEAAEALRAQLAQLEKESDQLAAELERLSQLAQEAKRKYNLLRARKKVTGAASTATPSEASEVAASQDDDDIETRFLLDTEIERAFQELEKKDAVERELEHLKRSRRNRK